MPNEIKLGAVSHKDLSVIFHTPSGRYEYIFFSLPALQNVLGLARKSCVRALNYAKTRAVEWRKL